MLRYQLLLCDNIRVDMKCRITMRQSKDSLCPWLAGDYKPNLARFGVCPGLGVPGSRLPGVTICALKQQNTTIIGNQAITWKSTLQDYNYKMWIKFFTECSYKYIYFQKNNNILSKIRSAKWNCSLDVITILIPLIKTQNG